MSDETHPPAGDRAGGLTPEQLSALVMKRRRRNAPAGPGSAASAASPSSAAPAASAASAAPAAATVGAPEPGALVAGLRPDPIPASFAQQRLWLLERLQGPGSAYNMPFFYRLRGALDRPALAHSLARLAARHESLRTTFGDLDGQPVQVIAPPPSAAFPLPVVDLRGLGDAARESEAARLRDRWARHPFDLERGPLHRGLLLVLEGAAPDAPAEHHLLLSFHHIVFDGWSMGVLWRELAALYGAASRAAGAAEPPPPDLQYADFSLWQRRRLQGAELERHLGYWRERLAPPLPVLELPTDRPRPSRPRERGAKVTALLPPELATALLAVARGAGATLFHALLAAFKVLLGRLAGQDDVLVGAPHAGRDRVELEGVIGFFVNNLVLRTDLSGSPSFAELVVRVRDTVLGASAHQEVPFERLLEELAPERDLSRAPLFQVFFNMVDLPGGPPRLPGLEVEPIRNRSHVSKFDFTLYADREPHGIELALVYNPDLFDRPRIEELVRQFRHLLEQAAARPDAPVAGWSLATPAAVALLPDPRRPLPQAWLGSVHEALARRAVEVPDCVAVADAVGVLTYRELSLRAGRLAADLAERGVGRGDVVAIHAYRDASLAVAIYGVLWAGAAYSILDPVYPERRLAEYVRQLAPRALVVQAAAGPLPAAALDAAATRPAVVELPPRGTAAEHGFLAGKPPMPPAPVGEDDIAVVTFTSGSTGVPKGVLGRHGPLTAFLPWLAERFGLGADDRYSLFSALSHDPLQRDLFVPGWLGAVVAMPDEERLATPGWLAGWTARERITVAGLTPAMLDVLASAGPPAPDGETAPGARLPDLRRAFVVGDALTRRHLRRLVERAPAVALFNLYGSTETQRSLAFQPFDASALAAPGPEVLPLGRGIDGVQLLVVTGDGRLAGIGEAGEIWVRSRQLAAGYLGDERLSAERFVANPFAAGDGGADPRDRVYRTGDRGRYRPDGSVEFAGRGDGQVKVRGFRIETAEVEAVVSSVAGVAAVAVTVSDDLPGGRGLVAYVVPPAGSPPPPARRLRDAVAARLPSYMVPAAFVSLDRLPMTATGKLDRRALPAPAAAGDGGGAEAGETGGTGGEPVGPLEELLAGLWAELLGREAIGRHESFFDLGGHSLLGTRMLARLGAVLGEEVPLAALFERPTVAALADELESGVRGEALPPLEPAPLADRRLLSWAEQRLWFLDRLEEGHSAAYNLVAAVTLAGELDPAALAAALGRVTRRHLPLASRYATDAAGEPRREVEAGPPPAPPVVDLSGLPAARRRAAAVAAAGRAALRPFALATERPLAAYLLRLGAREHALVAVVHHIAADAWSIGVLFRELAEQYRGVIAEPGAPPPAPPAVDYADYAAWQRAWLSGEVLEAQLAYWRAHLAGAPDRLDLPTDRPRPKEQTFRGARVETRLPAATADALAAFCRRERATLFMVLLAGFQALAARLSGQDDLVVGTPVANRRHPALEGLVGLFANTLALRADLADDPTFGELVARARRDALGAFAHQDLPFERLVDDLEVPRDLGRSPLFQVMFVLQNAPREGAPFAGLEMSPLPLPGVKSPYEMTLHALETGDGPKAVLEYDVALFDAATAGAFLERWRGLVAAAVAAPERRVSELPLLTAEERRQLLGEWNAPADPASPPPSDLPATVVEWIAATAARHPERLAVTAGPEGASRLTYGELVARADAVAGRLTALGVGAEARVGILLERSIDLVPALLGVLAAGAAYVPLDPSYPRERLDFVVEDSGLAALVTERSLADRPLAPEVPRVVVDDLGGAAAGSPLGGASAGAAGAGGDRLAYVIYTSGSTGRPKGVAIPHRALVNFLASMARRPGIGPDDVVAATTTVAFDIAGLELYLPLVAGARVDLVDRETAADGVRLGRRLAGATLFQATPTSWRLLLDSGWPGAPDLEALAGGEALPAELAARLAAATGELWNVYGPTETTVWSTVARLEAPRPDAPVPVGRPIDRTTVYLLDRRGRPVPPGVVGELAIGGVGLARGYLGRPGLTATVFVPDPFAGEEGAAGAGARLYRTGDLARRRRDGTLEVLGRRDGQVKVRGHRIETGEVESALVAHPRLVQAAVVAEEAPGGGGARLVAYTTAAADGPPTLEALRAHLGARLPDYMIPAVFVTLEELPRTPNGKVDRRALAAAAGRRVEAASAREAPAGPAEEALAAIWREVLGVTRVGRHDAFFVLGGDSISAIRVVTRAAAEGWRIVVRDLFQHQTLAALAAVAEPITTTRDEPPAAADERPDAPTRAVDTIGTGLSGEELDALLAEIEEV